MKKNNKKIIKFDRIFPIYIVLFILLWIVGMILTINNNNYGNIIITISTIFISLPFLILISYPFFLIIKKLLKLKKWYYVITAVILIISVILFINGAIVSFLGSSSYYYKIDQVKVVDVRNNKIFVDCSKYYNGDKEIIQINKPFFINIKKGDLISIKYPKNEFEKMHYVVDYQIGINMLNIGFNLLTITIIIWITFFAIKYFFQKNNL